MLHDSSLVSCYNQLGMQFKNRIQSILVNECYIRSLPSAIAALFLSLTIIFYQFKSPILGRPFLILGILIAFISAFRALISYLGIKQIISKFEFLPAIHVALLVNAGLWGIVFSLDAWHSSVDGLERIVAFALMLGLTATSPIALIATPRIQVFFYTVTLLSPAVIYSYRIANGSLPNLFVTFPIFLILFFFYQLSTGRNLLRMLITSLENNLKLQLEQENLKLTLEQLRTTQVELFSERARTLNSERLAFLGSMASGVAHEINNPLTISGGQLDKLQSYLATHPGFDDNQQVASLIDRLKTMNLRIQKIVRGLQYFATDKATESHEPFSLEELIALTTLFYFEKMKSLQIQFATEIPPQATLKGQKSELSQALVNIIDNAVEAVQSVLNRKISLSYSHSEKHLEIIISDNGPGIDPTIKDHIFHPFFTTKDVGQGTGLGLSIARGIIQSHGGDLRFTSTPGATSFIVSLPINS